MYDLGFGYTGCITDISRKLIKRDISLFNLDYVKEECIRTLENKVYTMASNFLSHYVGDIPAHVSIVSGAMNGLNIIINSIEKDKKLYINNDHFGYYRSFRDEVITKDFSKMQKVENGIALIDSPNNPTGSFLSTPRIYGGILIHDAVYANPIYVNSTIQHVRNNIITSPDYTVISFGKMFGMSGLRIGAVFSRNLNSKLRIDDVVETVQCGLNSVSCETLAMLLSDDMSYFFKQAKKAVNRNRDEMNRLRFLFGSDVPKDGMFYYPEADNKLRKLLCDCNVTYVDGVNTGNKDRIRLNLCTSYDTINGAVNNVLKKDRV